MIKKKIFMGMLSIFLVPSSLLIISGCTNNSDAPGDSNDTGGIAFALQRANESANEQQASSFAAQSIDCVADQIETISAVVYSPGGDEQSSGGPWNCSVESSGTIQGVPAGSDKRVVVTAQSSDQVKLWGEHTGVEVLSGQTTQLDPIVLSEFTPSLLSPTDNAAFGEGDPVVLQWQSVTGGYRYSVEIAGSDNFVNADRIDDIAADTHDLGTTLLTGDYFWRVKAFDRNNNESPWSTFRHISVSAAPKPPISVSHPTQGPIPSDGEYNFGSQNVYETVNAPFTIQNTGDADLTLSGINLISGDVAAFSITTESTSSPIPPEGTRTFTASCYPTTGGNKSANISIDSDAGAFAFNVSAYAYDFHGISIIDSAGDLGMYSSIAVEEGRIYIGYFDATNTCLKVAKSEDDGINWSFSSITNGHQMGKGASIAVDGSNVFVSTVIKEADTVEQIGLVKSDDNGATWEYSPLDTEPNSGVYGGYFTSLALDGQYAYITYLSGNNMQMCVVKSSYDGTYRTLPEISSPTGNGDETGYHSSIKVVNNTLYISHSGYDSGDIFFTRLPDSLSEPDSFVVDQVGETGTDGFTSLSFNPVGSSPNVYIAYYDQSSANQDLKFARSINNGDNFSTSTIDDSVVNVGKYPSMATDNNRIYISYYDETNGNLKLAISEDHGSNWQIKTIDAATDDVGLYTSLAVNGDKVYISYYDATNGDLKFAKSVDAGNTWN